MVPVSEKNSIGKEAKADALGLPSVGVRGRLWVTQSLSVWNPAGPAASSLGQGRAICRSQVLLMERTEVKRIMGKRYTNPRLLVSFQCSH